MPVYREGDCYTCGEHSDRLLPYPGCYEGRWMVAYCCPTCREYFEWTQEQTKEVKE